MSPDAAIILGIGQPMAGDDGVGFAVVRELTRRGVRAHASTDASLLLSLLAEGRRVVVVDAVAGPGAPGDVLALGPEALGDGRSLLSSHGVGVGEALSLARVLYGDAATRGVALVGVVIARPEGLLGEGLSPAVAAAVRRAAALAESLARARG